MIIAKKDMQHLIDADTGVLPLTRADITVFNLRTDRLARLNITDALRSDDIVCLCDPANQPWDRPPPEPVDASMFRKLGQDELEDGFHFNNLMFTHIPAGGSAMKKLLSGLMHDLKRRSSGNFRITTLL